MVGESREATDDDFEDPNKLYTCAEERRCCTEDAKPSCCGDMDEHEEIMRQVRRAVIGPWAMVTGGQRDG